MEQKLNELINYQNDILNRLDQNENSKEEILWNHTTITVCCISTKTREEIDKDFQEALHVFNSSKEKYALIHTGKYIYGIGEYQTRMYKFNIISHQIQHIDGPYPGRNQFGLAANTHQIVLIGGLINEEKSTSSNLLFDLKQEQWYSLPDIPLRNNQGVYLSGICFIDHYTLIIVGGLMMTNEGGIAMRKCFRLNLNKRKWFRIASCNEARGQPIINYYSDKIYAIGGFQYIYDEYKIRRNINVISIEEYNIHTDQWTILTAINQLRYQKNVYCTTNGILIGTDEKTNSWSYDLINRYLTCNFGLSA